MTAGRKEREMLHEARIKRARLSGAGSTDSASVPAFKSIVRVASWRRRLTACVRTKRAEHGRGTTTAPLKEHRQYRRYTHKRSHEVRRRTRSHCCRCCHRQAQKQARRVRAAGRRRAGRGQHQDHIRVSRQERLLRRRGQRVPHLPRLQRGHARRRTHRGAAVQLLLRQPDHVQPVEPDVRIP